MAKLAVVEDAPQGEPKFQRPRLITALGKQKAGKTLFLQYYIERSAGGRQRPLKLVDADPHNDTLLQHYAEALSPDSSGLDDRRIFLEQVVRDQAAAMDKSNPHDVLVDIGGGDLLLSRLARDVRFTDTLDGIGIELIAFYMLSPFLSDLDYFQKLEESGFHPKRLALVFNAGLIPGDRRPDRAFDAMMSAPLILKLLNRGAQVLFMPSLASDCVEAVERIRTEHGVVTFRDTLSLLDVWHRSRLETWLDQKMETQVAKHLIDWGWLV